MRQFSSSAAHAIHAEMNRLRREAKRIYNFGSGSPSLPNHPRVLEEVEKTVKGQISPYAPVGGLEEVREAAAHWMNQRYGSQYGIDHTIVTCGGKFALFAALMVLLEPGEEVVFGAPYWPSYPDMIRISGGIPKPISVNEKTDWKITPEDLKRNAGKKTRVFLFNNSTNPTGAHYSKEEVAALLQTAHALGLWIISDEVCSELVYDNAKFISCAAFPEYRSRMVVIESCSKNFAMGGYRVGFALAEVETIQSMIAVQSQTTTGTSFISQRAAFGALHHARDVSMQVRRTMDQRRKLFFYTYNQLFQTSFKPVASGLYFFAKVSGSCEDILRRAHVALLPGDAFGLEGYARFSFTESEEEIVEGLKAFRKF